MKGFAHLHLLLAALIALATVVVSAEQCGKNAGNAKCPDNLCCSQYGFCGSTSEYCGSGCQPDFGKCDSSPKKETSCGVKNGAPCPVGECCSKDGRCGTSDEFCGEGCNLNYGRCKNTSTDGLCGAKNGKSCPSTQCCSSFGFCGYAEPFCNEGCDPKFGRCNGNGGAGFKPGALHGTCQIDGTFAVSFDDGPAQFTKHLLEKLGDRKVTFFVNGNNFGCIYDYAEDLLEAKRKGHMIAAHTWSHPKLSAQSDKEIRYQFLKLNEALYKITGCRAKYMRPPFGDIDARGVTVARHLDMQLVIWDIDSTDTAVPKPSLQDQEDHISKTVKESPFPTPHIILSHDVIQTTAEQLSFFMLHTVTEGGWHHKTIGECFNDDPSNWYVCDRKPMPRDSTWKCDPSDRSLEAGGTLEFEISKLILEGKAKGYHDAKKMLGE